ncbi:MAG: hypothetical protein OXN21_01820, partial [Chloroflexota bacterium]|nr:hypothetical protein [Chloroflexota bacterium]
ITDDGADYLMPVKERQSALHGELVGVLYPLETERKTGYPCLGGRLGMASAKSYTGFKHALTRRLKSELKRL